jgi:hypothetical protein
MAMDIFACRQLLFLYVLGRQLCIADNIFYADYLFHWYSNVERWL